MTPSELPMALRAFVKGTPAKPNHDDYVPPGSNPHPANEDAYRADCRALTQDRRDAFALIDALAEHPAALRTALAILRDRTPAGAPSGRLYLTGVSETLAYTPGQMGDGTEVPNAVASLCVQASRYLCSLTNGETTVAEFAAALPRATADRRMPWAGPSRRRCRTCRARVPLMLAGIGDQCERCRHDAKGAL